MTKFAAHTLWLSLYIKLQWYPTQMQQCPFVMKELSQLQLRLIAMLFHANIRSLHDFEYIYFP